MLVVHSCTTLGGLEVNDMKGAYIIILGHG